MRLAFFAAVAAAALVLAAPDARANGRFPQTNALFPAPSDPDFFILRTTFGEMVSHDHGTTWSWVCEQSLGLSGTEDPMFAIMPNSTILGTTFEGLAISRDQACNFGFVGGALSLVFADLTNRLASPGTVVAFASSYGGQNDAGAVIYTSTLFETVDQGETFNPLPYAFDPSILGETVDVTESDPDRIYVSAIRNPGDTPTGLVLTSIDHGKTFTESPVTLAPNERGVYIAAVDPKNADRLYVRTVGSLDIVTSRLLVSTDAGKTFAPIFTGTGPLAGFALSSDGSRIFVGSEPDGLWSASSTDYQFTKTSSIEVDCLKFTADGLWACSTEKSGFILGLSADNGATFAPKLHFCDITGPLTCPSGSTTNNACTLGLNATPPGPPWPLQRITLGCSDVVDAGSDGGDASVNDPGLIAGTDPSDSGCGVSTPRATFARPFAALGAAMLTITAIALTRRRRRRR